MFLAVFLHNLKMLIEISISTTQQLPILTLMKTIWKGGEHNGPNRTKQCKDTLNSYGVQQRNQYTALNTQFLKQSSSTLK